MSAGFLINVAHSFRRGLRCDVFQLEAVTRSGREAIDMRRSGGGALFQVKVYGACERGLDEMKPLLQNLGLRVLDQIQFKVKLEDYRFFIRVFSFEPMLDGLVDLLPLKKLLLPALSMFCPCRQKTTTLARIAAPFKDTCHCETLASGSKTWRGET